MNLSGRSIVVTGAGQGVGRGIALACARQGAHIVVASPGDNGAAVVAEIVERGGAAAWARCDVTIRSDVQRAVETAISVTGHLDALVHNATSRRSSEPVALQDVDDELWNDHASVSLRGSYYCAVEAFAHLARRHGRLVLMSSPAGMEGSRTLPVYGIVKAAIRGLAKSLAREWAPHGVTVAVVSPLAMTPAMNDAFAADAELEQRLARAVPMGRLGDPENDIGPVVAFLAGDGARYITGQTIVVDGGRYLGL